MIKKFDNFVNEHYDVASQIVRISPEKACKVLNDNTDNKVSLLLTTSDEELLDNFINAIANEMGPAMKDRFLGIYKVVSE